MNLVLSGGALLLACGVLEGVIRVLGVAHDPQYDQPGQGIRVDSDDPEIRKELPAGFDGVMLGARVRTNSHGFRGPEVAIEKAAGVFRIVVLGDSWAFGWGVDQGQDFPAVLEGMLRSANPEAGVWYEVLNFSVYAYNTRQERAVLERRALRFSPDLVLVAYNVNDVEDLDGKATKPDGERLLRRWEQGLARNSHLFRLLDDRARRLALRLDLERSGKIEHYEGLYADDSPAWATVQDELGRIRDLAAAHHARTYLVQCPWIHVLTSENPYRPIHHRVMEAADRLGIPALDLFPEFEGRDAAALRISPLDGHPAAEGHRIAAEAVLRDLLERGLLDRAGSPSSVLAGEARFRGPDVAPPPGSVPGPEAR